MPFELSFTGRGIWRAMWDEEKVVVLVAGTGDAPYPTHAATLRNLVTRWSEQKRAIATFVAGLAPDAPIRFDPPVKAKMTAADCGFDGVLGYQSIAVLDRDAPTRAEVTFYTGLPDGYASYRVVLESGLPIDLSAFWS